MFGAYFLWKRLIPTILNAIINITNEEKGQDNEKKDKKASAIRLVFGAWYGFASFDGAN